jgi:hypothetical protein
MGRKKTGPTTLGGSKRARQITVAVLEALSGEVGTTEAAEKLGVSLSRYYQLEARALAGMLEALEPKTKGPQKTPEREIVWGEQQASRPHPRDASGRSAALAAARCSRRCATHRTRTKEERMGRRSEMEALVDAVPASRDARERTKVLLMTLAGPWSVCQGYQRLGIRRTRYQDLRRRMLEGAVRALEQGPVGRPPRPRPVAIRELQQLRRRVVELEHELRCTQAELEIARSDAGAAVAARLAAKGARR